ncbi:MAG: hypothetical protein LBP56_00235 [Odoribacteraceae bacterium]|nr:hypothetical protein [Odoribacteraceae bacterium]
MIEGIYIDEIVTCVTCKGKGWTRVPAPNTCNEYTKKTCDQCHGTGLIQLTGKLNVHAYIPPYYDTKGEN